MTDVRQFCNNCRFWAEGDLNDRIGNFGQCTYMLVYGSEVKDKRGLPFWAHRLSRQTTSWEGDNCPVWAKTTKKSKRG